MKTKFILQNEGNKHLWNKFIRNNKNSTIFHTLEWKNLIEKTYGFKPLYYIIYEKNKVIGLLPLFKVHNLRSKKIVSLPLSMYGGPLLEDNKDLSKILNFLIKTKESFAIHTKISISNAIPKIEKALLNTDFYIDRKQKKFFENNTKKRQIKFFIEKNKKLGTKFYQSSNINDLKNFIELFIKTRKRQKLFIPSPKYLKRMFKFKNKPIFFFSIYKKKRVAALFCLRHKNNIYNVYNCTSNIGRKISASDHLFYNAISYCMNSNLRFYFGGAQNDDNKGLINYKKKWGSQQEDEYIYTNNGDFLKIKKFKKNGSKIVKFMPTFIYKKIGHYFIKHFY